MPRGQKRRNAQGRLEPDSQQTDVLHQGFLLTETNFHVYAYTDSDLRISLLSMFADIVGSSALSSLFLFFFAVS